MPRTMGCWNCARPVNSRVKNTWLSLGSDAIAFRSSIGAQATPTAYTVIPVTKQEEHGQDDNTYLRSERTIDILR